MAGKKSFELTGSTVMLLAGALALAAALYWVVFLGRGAEAPVSEAETDTPAAVAAQDDVTPEATEEVVVQDDAAPEADAVVEAEPAADPVVEPVVEADAEPEGDAEADAETETASDTGAEGDAEAGSEEAPAEETANQETASDETGEQETATQDTAPEVVEAPVGPSFDVVRIDPQGAAVIAGTAAPGAEVILRADGVEVGRAKADLTGNFVALFDMPPSDAPRSLSAESVVEGGEAVASAGTVLIAPVRPAPPVQVAEAEPEPAPEPEAVTEPEAEPEVVADAAVEEEAAPVIEETTELADAEPSADEETNTNADVAVAEVEAPEGAEPVAEPEVAQPEAPTIVLADDSGITVLQGAEQPAVPSQSPQVAANLVIDTITYDDSGEVALAGRGQGAGFARVYLDGRPVQTVQIAPDGTWRTPLPDVDAGVYRLRIDELDAEGTVTSRVETPFQREEPEVVAEAAGRPNVVTVQKGFTLWAIAEDRFGSGIEYVRVYEANRDLIRDPDLIYPGQVFAIPEG